MNSRFTHHMPVQTIEQVVEWITPTVAQRNSLLCHKGPLSPARMVMYFLLPLIFLLVVTRFGLTDSALAEPSRLTGDKLRQVVSGRTVHVATPIGPFPIRYLSDGTITSRAPAFIASLGTESDRGKWWIAGDRLCQRWYRWLDAKKYCFELQRDGATVYWLRDDGLSGTATIRGAVTTIRSMSSGLERH
jgi:hypothetical protein